MLRKWEELPIEMQTEEVRRYYDILNKKRGSLLAKRIFDIVVSAVMIVFLSPLMLLIAVLVKVDSKGPVFFRQVRVTTYGKHFRIFKYRTMVNNAENMGTQVTVSNDSRITGMGKFLRGSRLDELGQLFDIFRGTMSFVGTRPEVPKYVEKYTPEMMATLLLPAGVTSMTSVYYKDEGRLLDAAQDPDRVYIEEILPGKMEMNLKAIEEYSFWQDIKVMIMTVFAILGKEYEYELEYKTGYIKKAS